MVAAGSRDSGRAAALGCRAHTGWAALVVVAGGVARPEVVFRGRAELGDPRGRVRRTSITRPAHWSPLRRPTSSKAPSESPPNKRPPLSSERCARRGTRAPSCVRAQSSSGRPPVKRGLRRSSRHTPSCMRRRGGSSRVRCCRAPRPAHSTPSPSRSGRSGRRARRHSASAGTSRSIGSTSSGERSGRPGRRTRSWRGSPRGSRSRDRLDPRLCEQLARSAARCNQNKPAPRRALLAGARDVLGEAQANHVPLRRLRQRMKGADDGKEGAHGGTRGSPVLSGASRTRTGELSGGPR